MAKILAAKRANFAAAQKSGEAARPLRVDRAQRLGEIFSMPVSYTHLDVYKRQAFCFINSIMFSSAFFW